MKKYIKFNLLKFTLLQALIPPVFFFSFNILVGFEIPMIVLLGFSLIGAIGFALAGATMAAMVLDSVMINDEIKNTSQIIGRGSVQLSNAKDHFLLALFLLL
ncbi:hypothetical protein [Desulfosudis oleivorans]|uniref:hypothetical protein n=1 Tax=Desulfosudis oleivorans TaxID=181663 RepID=UPI00059D83B7|nr:hypothetical protein [Desulfosudis oleivorans]